MASENGRTSKKKSKLTVIFLIVGAIVLVGIFLSMPRTVISEDVPQHEIVGVWRRGNTDSMTMYVFTNDNELHRFQAVEGYGNISTLIRIDMGFYTIEGDTITFSIHQTVSGGRSGFSDSWQYPNINRDDTPRSIDIYTFTFSESSIRPLALTGSNGRRHSYSIRRSRNTQTRNNPMAIFNWEVSMWISHGWVS